MALQFFLQIFNPLRQSTFHILSTNSPPLRVRIHAPTTTPVTGVKTPHTTLILLPLTFNNQFFDPFPTKTTNTVTDEIKHDNSITERRESKLRLMLTTCFCISPWDSMALRWNKWIFRVVKDLKRWSPKELRFRVWFGVGKKVAGAVVAKERECGRRQWEESVIVENCFLLRVRYDFSGKWECSIVVVFLTIYWWLWVAGRSNDDEKCDGNRDLT